MFMIIIITDNILQFNKEKMKYFMKLSFYMTTLYLPHLSHFFSFNYS